MSEQQKAGVTEMAQGCLAVVAGVFLIIVGFIMLAAVLGG